MTLQARKPPPAVKALIRQLIDEAKAKLEGEKKVRDEVERIARDSEREKDLAAATESASVTDSRLAAVLAKLGKPKIVAAVDFEERLKALGLAPFYGPEHWPSAAAVRELNHKIKGERARLLVCRAIRTALVRVWQALRSAASRSRSSARICGNGCPSGIICVLG